MGVLPLTGIVFSRDRAMQLDAMLRSLIRHCTDFQEAPFYLIYRTSSPQHARQYSLLKKQFELFPNIYFVAEENFRNDLIRCAMAPIDRETMNKGLGRLFVLGYKAGILNSYKKKDLFILFLVDDSIFVSDYSLASIIHSLLENPKALGFSLRLGLNTTHCYTTDMTQMLSDYRYQNDEIIEYDWLLAEGDFGYPLEISSSVYRSRDILNLISRLNFDNPNTLESLLASYSNRLSDLLPSMLCYERSVTFCNPINKVQNVFDNRAGSCTDYSSQSLADLFDDGYRINIDVFSTFIPSACHEEVDLIFTNMNSEAQ